MKDNVYEKLIMIDYGTLIQQHSWQNQIFPIKYFMECGRIISFKD